MIDDFLRKTSTNDITCKVFPKPIAWAKTQPKPAVPLTSFNDSIILSYRNLKRKNKNYDLQYTL